MTLKQHLTETDAVISLRDGHWDVVVLQDQSSMSFRPYWRNQMEQAASVFTALANGQGAEVFYYAHWAPSKQSHIEVEAIRTIEQTYVKWPYFSGQFCGSAKM